MTENWLESDQKIMTATNRIVEAKSGLTTVIFIRSCELTSSQDLFTLLSYCIKFDKAKVSSNLRASSRKYVKVW